jgi:hypothetical protein
MTFTANTVLTAAQMNVHLRDNMLASEVAQIQESHDYIVSDGYHQLARRKAEHHFIATGQTTKSTEYADLITTGGSTGTVGPTVTVTTGNAAWVILTAHMQCSSALSQIYMSYAITRPVGPLGPDGEPITPNETGSPEGGSTGGSDGGGDRDAGDNWGLCHDGLSDGGSFRRSYVDYISADLTPGENTFTCKYRVGSESVTGTFTNRSIIVIPM